MPSKCDSARAALGVSRRLSLGLGLLACAALAGCMGASGPSTGRIAKAGQVATANATQIQVIELDETAARRVLAASSSRSFAEVLGDGRAMGSVLGPGDVLSISIWEAPPAVLYSAAVDSRSAVAGMGAGGATALPEQMVDLSGSITVPYVGALNVRGLTTRQVELEIVRRLQGKAHDPQVVVRIARNSTANITVMGDVANSTRVPLSPKGERLLDVLAAAGGSRQPFSKSTVQITRGKTVVTMALQQVAQDPAQNIVMQADDVVNVMFQPFSFIALGAVANNAEVPFEGTGISLAQALGRMGGLRDDRANVRGVFVFRLENPTALAPELAANARQTVDGKVPVIYRLDLGNPSGFFIAQSFPVANRDVIYVSNAPVADLQKFVNIISSMTFSIVAVKSL